MANSLFNRVKERGYSCVTWSEKQYNDQKPTIANDERQNKILFLSRKCVIEGFSNPKLKPLLIDKKHDKVYDQCLFFCEGINAGILVLISLFTDDKFLRWMAEDEKNWKMDLFGVPLALWIDAKFLYSSVSPSMRFNRKRMREKLLWEAVEIFYEHYLDVFMAGDPLLPINGVTKVVENWRNS